MANKQDTDIDIFSAEQATKDESVNELIIGVVSAVDSAGNVKVVFSECAEDGGISAQSTVKVNQSKVGRQVALMFIGQDITKPIIIGLIRSQLDSLLESYDSSSSEVSLSPVSVPLSFSQSNSKSVPAGTTPKELIVDGKRIVIQGEDEVVFRCGESSITLTKQGKIVIRGKYLVNRASGVNRILGGSVQIN